MNSPETPPGYHHLFNHSPWDDGDTSDPEEADIEEHITHGPGGSVFIRQTIRSSTPRDGASSRRRRDDPDPNDPTYVMRDFQNMLGNLMGPGFRAGRPGRSGPDDLYGQSPFHATGFRMGGNGSPHVVGGRFTFTTGNLRPRNADGPMAGGPPVEDLATYASPPPSSASPNGRSLYLVTVRGPPDEIARMLGNIFGHMGPPPGDGSREDGTGAPLGLQGLFASLLNPANARHGDAVYSQEALDQIISTLMEQHPTSNAPGPASPHAIQALPKRKLDKELLGPEGKGECSVCMDDVHVGDEVVMLPCSHWFHEACASAWLSEHNTCPICRKGIGGDSSSNSGRSSRGPTSPNSRPEPRTRRLSLGSRLNRENISSRNESRLDSIRAAGRITPPPPEESRRPSRRHRDSYTSHHADEERPMPGSYRRRESEVSATYPRERDRRGNTSGSDLSQNSRQSSRSTNDTNESSTNNASGGGGGGPLSWLRGRFSSQSNGRRQD
jgi:division protein 1